MTSFDLHVLGMPPAFILSQDQTLHLLIFFLTLARLVSLFALLIPYSELTFPVQFSKIDFLASRLLRSALVYITILSLFRQAFFSLFFEENDMVPEAGLEPARYRYRRILSPLRLPVSPLGHATLLYINRRTIAIKNVVSVQKKRHSRSLSARSDNAVHLLLRDLFLSDHRFQHDLLLGTGILHMIAQLKVRR